MKRLISWAITVMMIIGMLGSFSPLTAFAAVNTSNPVSINQWHDDTGVIKDGFGVLVPSGTTTATVEFVWQNAYYTATVGSNAFKTVAEAIAAGKTQLIVPALTYTDINITGSIELYGNHYGINPNAVPVDRTKDWTKNSAWNEYVTTVTGNINVTTAAAPATANGTNIVINGLCLGGYFVDNTRPVSQYATKIKISNIFFNFSKAIESTHHIIDLETVHARTDSDAVLNIDSVIVENSRFEFPTSNINTRVFDEDCPQTVIVKNNYFAASHPRLGWFKQRACIREGYLEISDNYFKQSGPIIHFAGGCTYFDAKNIKANSVAKFNNNVVYNPTSTAAIQISPGEFRSTEVCGNVFIDTATLHNPVLSVYIYDETFNGENYKDVITFKGNRFIGVADYLTLNEGTTKLNFDNANYYAVYSDDFIHGQVDGKVYGVLGESDYYLDFNATTLASEAAMAHSLDGMAVSADANTASVIIPANSTYIPELKTISGVNFTLYTDSNFINAVSSINASEVQNGKLYYARAITPSGVKIEYRVYISVGNASAPKYEGAYLLYDKCQEMPVGTKFSATYKGQEYMFTAGVDAFSSLAQISVAHRKEEKINVIMLSGTYEGGYNVTGDFNIVGDNTVLKNDFKTSGPVKIACIGDSITEAVIDGGRATLGYPARLNEYLNASYGAGKYEVKNFGKGNSSLQEINTTTTTNMLTSSRSQYNQGSWYYSALDYNPDVVMIMIGHNDTQIATNDHIYKSAANYEKYYVELIESFKALPSNPQVIIVSCHSRSDAFRKGILENSIIPVQKELAKRYNTIFVDNYSVSDTIKDGWASTPEGIYSADNLHLSPKGYKLLAESIAENTKGIYSATRSVTKSGITVNSGASVAAKAKKIKIACIGDDLVYGKQSYTNFPTVLGELVGDGYEVRNYGECGSTPSTYYAGDGYGDISDFKSALAWKPDYAIINFGVNSASADSAFTTGLTNIVNAFKNAGTKVYLSTSIRTSASSGVWTVATNTGISVVDTYTRVLQNMPADCIKSTNVLNEKGHQKLGEFIYYWLFGKDFASTYTDPYGQISRSAVVVDTTIPTNTAKGSKYMYNWDGKHYNFYYGTNVFSSVGSAMAAVSGSSIQILIPARDTAQAFTVDNVAAATTKTNIEVFGVNRHINPNYKTSTNPLDDWMQHPDWGKNGESRVGKITIATSGSNTLSGNIKFKGITMCGGYADTARGDGSASNPLDLTATFENVVVDYQNGDYLFNLNTTNRRTATDNYNDSLVVKNMRVRQLTMSQSNAADRRIMAAGGGLSPAHMSFDGFYIKDNTNITIFGWQHAPNGNTNNSFLFKNSYIYGMGGFDVASSSVANRSSEVANVEFTGNVFMNTTGSFALELHSQFITKLKIEDNYFVPNGTTLPIVPRNDSGLNHVTSLGYSLKNNTIIASNLKTVLDNARLNAATTGIDISGSYVSTSLNGLALNAATITTGYVSNGYALDITRTVKTTDFNVNSVSFANNVSNLVVDNTNSKITATVNYGQLIENPNVVCSGDNVSATFKDEHGNPLSSILFECGSTRTISLELSKHGKTFKTYTVTFSVTPAPLWTSRDDSQHIIKNDAVAVIAEAGKKATNDYVSALFDGKYYRFIVGVNAFATLDAALATTAKQVIVPKGDLTKFEVTRSVEIYGVNYNVKPWVVEGEDVVQNPEWNEDGESAVYKTDVVITASATPKDSSGTTIVIAGFRLTQSIVDNARAKSNYKTSITLKNNILDRHILTGEGTREFNFHNANNANMTDASVTNIDEFTIENMFIVNRNPHTGHALLQEQVAAYFTLDGLACNQDTPALGFPKWGIGVKQGKMTLKNSYFRHHKDYSSRFTCHTYFSGYAQGCKISDEEISKRDLKLEISNNTYIDCYDGGTEGVIKIFPAAFSDINIDGNTMVATTDNNNRAFLWGDGSSDGYLYNNKDFTNRITFKNNRIIGYLPTHFVNQYTQINLDENYFATFMFSYRNGVSGDLPADIEADYYLDFNLTTKLSDMAPTDSSSIAQVKTVGKTRTIYGYASQNVNLSLSSNKGVSYTFYSDENCTKPISSLAVTLGNASKAYVRATRNNITVVYTLYVMGVKNVTDVTSATINSSLSGIGAPTLWYPSLYGASNGIEVVSYYKNTPVKFVTGQNVAKSIAEMGLYGDDIIFPDNITDISGLTLITAVNIYSANANIKSISTRKAKIACVGDSITEGLINGTRDYAYPVRMQAVLGTTSFDVQNYGGSGSTAQYMEYLRLQATAGDRERQYRVLRKSMYDASIAYNGDVVIIGLGTNDAAINEPERWSSNYNYINEYVKLIREYQALSSKPAIYITTATPRYDNNLASMMVQDNLRYIQRAVADITGAKVIDLNTLANHLFSASGTSYSDDKLHPNAAGYTEMGNIIANQFASTFTAINNHTITVNGGTVSGVISSSIANTHLALKNNKINLNAQSVNGSNIASIRLHNAVGLKNNAAVSSFTASELVSNGGNTKIDLSVADTTKTYSSTPAITVSNDDPIALLKALQVAKAGMTGVCGGIDWALTVNADTLTADEARTAVTAIRTGGHILTTMPGKDADCYNNGYTSYKACEHCDYTEGKTVIGSIAHETSVIESKDSTALELGYKEHYKCIHCNDYFEDAAATKPIDDIVLWRAGVGSIACKKVYNETTGVSYENINDALMAAVPGDKVVLMADDSADYAIVTTDVTLDLNGNSLSANYVVGFNGSNVVDNSADKTGKLITAKNTVKLAKDNAQMPIYDSVSGSYIFVSIAFSTKFNDANEYVALTAFGKNTVEKTKPHEILSNPDLDSGIEVIVRLSWPNNSYSGEQNYKYTREQIKTVVDSYVPNPETGKGTFDKNFKALFGMSDLGQDMINSGDIQVCTVVRSSAGVEAISSFTPIIIS